MGIDEISLKKGHDDFVVIITAYHEGRISILAVLPDRKKDTVKAFLQSIPTDIANTIHTACSDMYDGYLNAVKDVFPGQVDIVIDQFHVARNYRDAVDSLRKKVMKSLKETLSEEELDSIKGVMWPLRKNPGQLKKEDKKKLCALFSYSRGC